MKPIEIFLEEAFERESELGNLFTFDGAHVAKTSTERLDTLGVMISEENSQENFTSRMYDSYLKSVPCFTLKIQKRRINLNDSTQDQSRS